MKKKVVLGLMVGTLTLGIGTGALAATGLEPIKAYLNSKISLKLNGTTVTAKDANGKTVLPITYNGTTYLPVRAVGTLLGTEITYDSATSSVNIGSSNGSAPPSQTGKLTLSSLGTAALGTSDWHTKDPAETAYKGKDYKDVYLHTDTAKQGKSFQVMTQKKYAKLHLDLAVLGGSQKLEIMDENNTTLKTVSLAPEDGLVGVDVDVADTDAIFVEIVDEDPGASLFVPLTTSYLTKK
ncbi:MULTISPECIES: stalk domain-containing protein [unclassified Paenibacillus]|uniref:stalk domain-containing protein n=1 Tax=unclassified Paenibacillus TaxID=185978 RepID=UPI0009A8FF89|nr:MULTISPECIES: stalk domain-containing protein [unclassified Paenibacillus]SLK02597.1 Copper amine oxidase N-terminal domain-containing protein [Paenibacillus sp. RU5A]SOC69019.1 Copper amine oxidase N-terminal domain-containing protein [Paenibacillus sp. RU26A]SOC71465.1 Copper amine oxidase N-terminal domain-containing protein [Paenibacillus sp. RU5M]